MKSIFQRTVQTKFDYIVIGGGTAGCLLANRLSRCPSNRVVLLQAGRSNPRNPLVKIPIGNIFCIGRSFMDWCYHTDKQPGLNGRSISYPRGKILGGCSSINGMIYIRGHRKDYDNWAGILRDKQWSWQSCLPYFKKHEDFQGEANQFHNKSGEWKVTNHRVNYRVMEKVREAVLEYGVPWTDDFNTGENFGCGHYQINQEKGDRWSTADGFLGEEVRSRDNLKVYTGMEVDRLIVENNRVKGCLAKNANKEIVEIICDKELILSAGAIGSPAILQRSGIGGKWLQQNNICKVKVELDGVGENLQDHLQFRPVYKVKNIETLNSMLWNPLQLSRMAYSYLIKKSGPLTMAPAQLGAFLHSSLSAQWPDLQYHFMPLAIKTVQHPFSFYLFDSITLSVCDLRPKSRGTVQITSCNPSTPPKIIFNYLKDEQDGKKAIEAIKITRKIMQQSAMKQYQPEEHVPAGIYQNDDEILKIAGQIGTSIYHPCGTCKMGPPQDRLAVVDNRLRLRGVEGVRVVDASVMPQIVSGNTNSPTLMIAEKAAEWILS